MKLNYMVLLALFFTVNAHAIQIIPANPSGGEKLGKALGDGFARGMEEARQIQQAREFREELEKEHRIANELSYYNSVVSQLSFEPAHPTLILSEEAKKPFIHKSYIKMNDNRTMGCLFKMKFNRVLSDGVLVEWFWSLDISNETEKKIFSFGNMEYPKTRFKIELLDDNNFVISSCIYYSDVFLKRGKSTTLQGKWIIPYDQLLNFSTYRINIVYP